MTDPFSRFGIEHLSPYSLNTFKANPALWCGRYLFKWQGDAGPAAKRGLSVEAGLDVMMFQTGTMENAIARTMETFARETNGQADEEHEKERAVLEPMLKQAVKGLADRPIPQFRQQKVEVQLPGVEIPMIGYVDYLWEDMGLDLKTTLRMPSKMRPDHMRQLAFYSTATAIPFWALYVTGSKLQMMPLAGEDVQPAMDELTLIARTIRHLLDKSDSGEEATRFVVPDFDHFMWDESTISEARKVWK